MTEAETRGAAPALQRDLHEGIVGGVVAGFAARLGVDTVALRIAFIVGVFLTGGALLIAYGIAWVLMPVAGGASAGALPGGWRIGRGWHLGAGVGLLVLAALLVFRASGIWWSDAVIWPLVLVSAGLAVLWGQSRSAVTTEDPAAPVHGPATEPEPQRSSTGSLYRGGFGVALVIGAALLFLSTNDALGAARDVAFTTIVAVVAVALILAPFIWRLGRNLAAERAERIRSQERAEMAAHLHDSVLQTLTLMQKRADDPREVAALARRQERELRSWLAGERRPNGAGPGEDGEFAAALRRAAAEVEDERRVQIDVVAVGDCELGERAAAVVAAAREAMVNAAKFAGEESISVYAEASADRIEAFVRDRGPGFDIARVPDDRRGVRDSILGRMRRNGGEATVRGGPGGGTEVALTVEREAS